MNPFEKGNVGGIEVKNRIFRAATHEFTALDDGKVSPAFTKKYQDLSEGEIGLIITGYMCFSNSDHPSPGTILIDHDDAVPGLKKLTDMVHMNGTRIVAQLSHGGSQLYHEIDPTREVFAPSNVTDPTSGITPTPFSTGQIRTFVKDFGEASLRAKQAGFDGIQIHGSHGYLLSKFLSPVYNERTDEYGGSPENNARILVEVLREIRTKCGDEYPVWVKLNCSDFDKGNPSLDYDDSLLVAAKALSANGIDAIELSGGTLAGEYSPCRSKRHEAYHLEYAKKLTNEVGTQVILVGGIRNPDTIEKILSETDVQAVSIGRPLTREPGLVKRWMDGDRTKATCVACNGCFNPKGTRCIFELEGEERKAQKEMTKMINSLSGDRN